MTKRILGYGIAAAAAVAFALPAAPAQAGECINMGTTPVECTLEKVGNICPIEGTQPTCLKNIST